MLVTSQLPIQATKFSIFFKHALVPLHFEKFSATHAYGWLVACFDAVTLFIFPILWTPQLQYILQPSARTL